MSSLTPREIVQELDKHIIGQDAAKRAVAIALRNRMRRQKVPPDMAEEIALLHRMRVVVGLGKIGFDAAVRQLADAGFDTGRRRPRFAHGAEYRLDGPPGRSAVVLMGTYHPSRQNTNTGKLTQTMLDRIFARARALAGVRAT